MPQELILRSFKFRPRYFLLGSPRLNAPTFELHSNDQLDSVSLTAPPTGRLFGDGLLDRPCFDGWVKRTTDGKALSDTVGDIQRSGEKTPAQ